MLMLCGQSNALWHYAAGKWPNKVGLLLGPSYYKKTPVRPWMPYVLDNDAFTLRENWNEAKWREMLAWARLQSHKPEWVLVPDVVGSKEGTLERWDRYEKEVRACGWPLAFAVQDGMMTEDVPASADVVFIGGTDSFKWRTVETWVVSFPRVHVGRVNNIDRVWQCDDLGVESVDGTGWFRDPTREDKLPALECWLAGIRNNKQIQLL
ncbi:MAG: hypothetical protein RIR25_1271 [Verrucomicrobiota bacterium]